MPIHVLILRIGSSRCWRAAIRLRLSEIVARLGGECAQGSDPQCAVVRVAPLALAGPEDISFIAQPAYLDDLRQTRAGAVVLSSAFVPDCPVNALVVPSPYLYYARLSQWLHPRPRPAPGIHPTAVLASLPDHDDIAIAAYVTVGTGVRLGRGVVLEAGCTVGDDVEIGDDCLVCSGARIGRGCTIGARSLIHANAVIGSDGFGYAPTPEGTWEKIQQIGRVLIGHDVEIGANTTIDRGALGDTVIGNGVKLDNHIQVAHNVRIGEHTIIAGCVGIAGSTVIGKRCRIGGAAMIIGHIDIADDTVISGGSFIGKSIRSPGQYSNSAPLLSHQEWLKNFSRLRHLDAMADKIRALESRLDALHRKIDS